MLIVSGAFGVFRRDALDGFSNATLGEHMEMTLRIHHVLRPQVKEARVQFVRDAVCWTEAQGTVAGLRNQRVRWHAGLLDSLRMHRKMFGRPRTVPLERSPCRTWFSSKRSNRSSRSWVLQS
jgi:cellulose synthase/poly-beta-1,6-N-acetylglucosamine synthase-like glycosyltransferase